MGETRDQNLKDLKSISDDQERLHFQLSLLWENGKFDPQKVREQIHELKLLQLILYFFISSGIVVFFILVFMKIHLIIIIIDVGVVVVYISYLKYITHKCKKILTVSKKEYKNFVKINKKSEILLILLLIFYSFIIIFSISLLIPSVINFNPLILITIICVSLFYFKFYIDVENDDSSKI